MKYQENNIVGMRIARGKEDCWKEGNISREIRSKNSLLIKEIESEINQLIDQQYPSSTLKSVFRSYNSALILIPLIHFHTLERICWVNNSISPWISEVSDIPEFVKITWEATLILIYSRPPNNQYCSN